MHAVLHLLIPVSCFISSQSHHLLFANILLLNPFFLYIFFKYWIEHEIQKQNAISSQSTGAGRPGNNRNRSQGVSETDPYDDNEIYVCIRNWLISIHVTLLFIFHRNIISILQASMREAIALDLLYLVLLSQILNLKKYNRNLLIVSRARRARSSRTPAGQLSGNSDTRPPGSGRRERILYMKLLLGPLEGFWKRTVLSTSINDYLVEAAHGNDNEAAGTGTAPGEETSPGQQSRSARDNRLLVLFEDPWTQSGLSSLVSAILTPLSSLTLCFCNIEHILICGYMCYFNITDSCFTRPTTMPSIDDAGTSMLWPSNCRNIFYDANTESRITMYCAMIAAQVACVHAVIFLHSIYKKLFT